MQHVLVWGRMSWKVRLVFIHAWDDGLSELLKYLWSSDASKKQSAPIVFFFSVRYAQPASWFVWLYVCQDDYGNVDNSCWRFETACDQHSADKALCKQGEYCMSEWNSELHVRGIIICSKCSVISKVLTVSLCYGGNTESNMQIWNIYFEQCSVSFYWLSGPVAAWTEACFYIAWCFWLAKMNKMAHIVSLRN